MKCSSLIISTLLGLMLMALPVQAEVPSMITYQGVLSDVNGIPLNGDHSLGLAIYTQAEAGTAIWSETHTTVAVKRGVFNIMLGGYNALNIPFDQQYWLGISLDGGAEMTPRVQFASVGTALMAKTAEVATVAQDVAAGAVVQSINGVTDDVLIQGEAVTQVGNTITIAGGGGVDVLVVNGANVAVVKDQVTTATVTCPAGYIALNGYGGWYHQHYSLTPVFSIYWDTETPVGTATFVYDRSFECQKAAPTLNVLAGETFTCSATCLKLN